MKLTMETVARAVLVGCLLLAGAIYVLPTGAAEPPSAPPETFEGQIAEARVTSIPATAAFTFAQDMAPPAAVDAAALPRLVGIAGNSAYLRGASGTAERVGVGSDLDGWRVTRIEEKAVTLTDGNRTERLEIFRQSN